MWRVHEPERPGQTLTTPDAPTSPRRARAVKVGCYIVPSALLAAMALFVVFVPFLNDPPRLGAIPFEQGRWKAGGEGQDGNQNNPPWFHGSARLRMTRSLLAHHRLVGMNWRQVVDLLGPPEDGSHRPVDQPQVIAYYLGYPSDDLTVHPFPHTLILDIDSTGRVSGWRIDTGDPRSP